MWVSVYINPPKQFGSADRQGEKNVVVFVFYHPFFFFSPFPLLLWVYGECQHASKNWDGGAGAGYNLESVAVSGGCLLGLISVFFWRWILSSRSAGCDVIVYYPTASVSNRELAGGSAAGELYRSFEASVLLKCPWARHWISARERERERRLCRWPVITCRRSSSGCPCVYFCSCGLHVVFVPGPRHRLQDHWTRLCIKPLW